MQSTEAGLALPAAGAMAIDLRDDTYHPDLSLNQDWLRETLAFDFTSLLPDLTSVLLPERSHSASDNAAIFGRAVEVSSTAGDADGSGLAHSDQLFRAAHVNPLPFWLTWTDPLASASGGLDNRDSLQQVAMPSSTRTDWLSDAILIPAIAIFFEKLHPIIPIFTRSWILERIASQHHRQQPGFAAMLLALCALTKVQAMPAQDNATHLEARHTARLLLEESVRMRASSTMGSNQSLDDVLASLYTFCTLTGLQEQNAFRFRLRESLHLGLLFDIHRPDSYLFLDTGEQERRLRTYWLLCITERALALWTGEAIVFREPPISRMAQVVSNLEDGRLDDFPRRQLQLLQAVDDSFLYCWHKQCDLSNCHNFGRERAYYLHASFSAVVPWQEYDSVLIGSQTISSLRRDNLHSIDIALTQQWLHCHIWQICFTHGLVMANTTEDIFSPTFPLHCGQRARHYYQTTDTASRDAHGIGLVQKLHDIGMAIVQAYRVPGISNGLKVELEKCATDIVAACKEGSEAAQTFGDRLEAAVMVACLNYRSCSAEHTA